MFNDHAMILTPFLCMVGDSINQAAMPCNSYSIAYRFINLEGILQSAVTENNLLLAKRVSRSVTKAQLENECLSLP